MRKVLLGVAALLVSGSLATAGEGLGLKVDVGLDVGVVESVKLSDGDIDSSGMAIVPSLAVTYAFSEQWSGTLWLRYLAGFEDDGADVDLVGTTNEGTVQISGLDIGVLAGYTFKLGDQFTVVPVAGLSWRSYSIDVSDDDVDVEGTEDASLLVLDLGAKAAYKLTDKLSIPFGLMLGLGLSGSAEIDSDGGDDDGDLDGIALLLEVRGGVEYKITDMISLTGGLAYEMLSVSWEWEDDSADEDLSRFSVQLGASFKF